ncbi:eCIS core domain-containing protein [Streptomyces sp. NPDC054995]
MRAQGKDRTGHSGDRPERAVAAVPAKEPGTVRQGAAPSGSQPLLALQATVGNAVAVQMLRRAAVEEREQSQEQDQGRNRSQGQDQERHRHGAGCGHEEAQRPAVQRSAVHDVLRTSGRPLEDTVRTDMESRLGADFSDVRVHDDRAAKASAAEVGARAYTSGSHVVIGDGGGDRHTLAHELTHVIQQRQGQVAGTDNGGGLKVSDPSDRFERAAEANARRVMAAPARTDVQRAPEPAGRPAPVAASATAVQRVGGNPQEMLGAGHWKAEMETAGHPLLPPKQKGKKKKAKAPVRKLEDILASVGPGLLAELKALAEKGETGRLKLYRTMMAEEANAIMEWKGLASLTEEWITSQEDTAGIAKRFRGAVEKGEAGIMPISNHLGDAGQADEYFTNEDTQVTVEFTLKPGAHELLFSPDYMAISGDKGTPYHIRKTRESADNPFPEAAGGEGALAGYIGLKPEEKEPFSLSIGKTDITRLLFQLFVEDMRAVRGQKNLTSGTA